VQAISRKLEHSIKQLEKIVLDLKSSVEDQDELIVETVKNVA
jgi:hypothetical protein